MDTRLRHSRPGFELGRGVIAEGRVPTPPIVESLDVLEDVRCRFFTGRVVPMVHALARECPEETFDTGVVPAVACAAHAGGDAVLAEQTLVAMCGVLAAAIRVVQETCRWCPVRQRPGEGPLGQIHGQPVAPRPPDHGARVQIAHYGEGQPALRGPHVGEVPGPPPGRARDRELAIAHVCRHRQPVTRLSRRAPLLHGLGPDPFDAHEPRDAMFADPVPPLDQGVPDAGIAGGLTGLPMDHPDGREPCAVMHRPGALGPACPGVIAGGRARARARAAHEPDGIAAVVLLDRAVSHVDSLAKHAAARRNKSRSFLRVSFSRVSRVSTSCPARTDWRV